MSLESTSVPPTTPSAPEILEDRTVAIVSYLTLIGFIAAVVIHSGKKTSLGSFHLRQTLGIIVVGVAAVIAAFVLAFIPILGPLMIFAIYAAMFVAWLHGFIMAATGKKTPIPVIGENFQKWFAGAFV